MSILLIPDSISIPENYAWHVTGAEEIFVEKKRNFLGEAKRNNSGPPVTKILKTMY